MAKHSVKTRVSEKQTPIAQEKPEIQPSTADAVARDLGGKSASESEDQADIYRLSLPIDRKTRKIAFSTMREKTKTELLET